MALNVRNPKVERFAAEVASETGESKTEPIRRALFEIQEVSFGTVHWREALDGFRRYGRRRHPAALNFGDCMTNAGARLTGEPLLCVGEDSPRTDLPLV